jgi:hypothetical protein
MGLNITNTYTVTRSQIQVASTAMALACGRTPGSTLVADLRTIAILVNILVLNNF